MDILTNQGYIMTIDIIQKTLSEYYEKNELQLNNA